MAFNLSGTDIQQYFDSNVAINTSLFLFLVLPPLLLCLLCVLALAFAEEINKKIRVLLINIFAAEICNWLSYSVFYLGWSVRLVYDDDITCMFFISCFAVAAAQKFTAGGVYAVNIYIFIKYGEKKLKWFVVIPFIIISWVFAALSMGIIPYFDEFGAVNINGFCTTNPEAVLFRVLVPTLIVLSLFFLSIQLICSILTIVYVKRNVLEGNKAVKKAVAKVLAYLAVASILSFINSVIPAANPAVRRLLPPDDIASVVAINYILRLVFNVPAIATPIVAIILLKPIRVAMKTMSKKVFFCCPTNQVAPAPVNHS